MFAPEAGAILGEAEQYMHYGCERVAGSCEFAACPDEKHRAGLVYSMTASETQEMGLEGLTLLHGIALILPVIIHTRRPGE